MYRRKFIVGTGSVVAMSFAGCLSTTGLTEHKSTPGSVDAEALASTGYQENAMEPIELHREVTVEGHTEEVLVVNHLTKYGKTAENVLQSGNFMVFTSPDVSIAGVGVNPLNSMDTDEILEKVLAQPDNVSDIEHDEDTAVMVLGEATESSRYTATLEVEDITADIYIRITETVRTENDDLLMTIAVYPQHVTAEDDNAITLAENTLATYNE